MLFSETKSMHRHDFSIQGLYKVYLCPKHERVIAGITLVVLIDIFN